MCSARDWSGRWSRREGDVANVSIEVRGRSYRHRIDLSRDISLPQGKGAGSGGCSSLQTKFDPDIIDVQPGERAYFDVTLRADGSTQHYEFNDIYDPWKWLRDSRPWLLPLLLVASVLLTLTILLYVRPLWIISVYRALKLVQIDKISIPGMGPHLQSALRGVHGFLPFFVTRARTLDAWVKAHRRQIEEVWEPDTQPEKVQDGHHPSTLYVPLPIRISDLSSGELIQEPNASSIGALFSEKRAVVVIVGAGGAGGRRHWLDKLDDGPSKAGGPAAFLQTPEDSRYGLMRSWIRKAVR